MDGFGKYDYIVQATGTNRLLPMSFTVSGLGDATSAETLGYFAELSSGNAGQGNQYFAAHLAGFATSDTNITSGYFAGSTIAPAPVPEPETETETCAMMLSGLGLIGFMFCSKKSVAQPLFGRNGLTPASPSPLRRDFFPIIHQPFIPA